MSQKNEMLFKRILEEARNKYNNQVMLNEMEECCQQLGIHDHILYILVNSKKLFSFLEDINLTKFNEIASSIYQDNIEVKFVENADDYEKIIIAATKKQEINSSKLDKNLTFGTYVVGDYNRIPVQILQNIIKEDKVRFNPIFLYGVTGIGKTHLSNAFAIEYLKTYPDRKVKLIDGQQFSKDFIDVANSSNKVEEFKRLNSLYNVFIIEDIQFLANREKSQEIFFSIFENLIKRGSLVIITSDRYSEHLNGFTDRMISRFASGLTLEMKEPGEEVVEEIVRERLKESNTKITEKALQILAKHFTFDIRKVLCMVNNLYVLSMSNNGKIISETDVREIAHLDQSASNAKSYQTLNLNPQSIINTVAKFYSLNASQLTSNTRISNVVWARSMAMYIMKNKIDLTFQSIGNFFGKSHSAVMHSVEKFGEELEKNEDLKIALDTILKKL